MYERIIQETKGPLLVGFLGTSNSQVVQQLEVEAMCRKRLPFLPVNEDPPLYFSHRIRGLPTYVLFHNGREVGRHLGRLDEGCLDDLLDLILGTV